MTEDADLGIRLALEGYRVADLPSATLEEAPIRLGDWLNQRTRWMKGFMQVIVTHSRHPIDAFRALGPAGCFGATTMTLGTVVTALSFPIFSFLSVHALADGSLFGAHTVIEAVQRGMGLTLFAAGYIAMTLPALVGLRRRGWWKLMPYVPLLPLYYCLISVAAWRAWIELLVDPDHWHKTEHGLARTSRSGLFRDSAATKDDVATLGPPPRGGDRG